MAPGTKVYVRWYGNELEGEVADGDGFMGMTPVRIPLDDHHPVALFFPQHVYESAELAKMQSSPVNSPNSPRSFPEFPGKTEEEPREISRTESKVDTNIDRLIDVWRQEVNRYTIDPVTLFKAYHWDEAHNHLRTECLEEFYQLWRKTHDRRPVKADDKAILTRTPPKPVHMRAVPQNGTPTNTKPQNKKMRCWRCEHLDFDHILCRQ